VSRLEDPDYGKLSSQTLFEVASAFELPLYIDMPDWNEWFRLMEDMSSRNFQRRPFDADYLSTLANDNVSSLDHDGPIYEPAEETEPSAPPVSVAREWSIWVDAFHSATTYGHAQELSLEGNVIANGAVQNRLLVLIGTTAFAPAINNAPSSAGVSADLISFASTEITPSMTEACHA
jgi:hypothetical protein